MTMQQVIMEEIGSAIKELNLELILSPNASNCGDAYIVAHNNTEIKSLGSMCYDFQPGTATFQVFSKGKKPQAMIGGKPDGCILENRFEYYKMDGELESFIKALVSRLDLNKVHDPEKSLGKKRKSVVVTSLADPLKK